MPCSDVLKYFGLELNSGSCSGKLPQVSTIGSEKERKENQKERCSHLCWYLSESAEYLFFIRIKKREYTLKDAYPSDQ